MSLPFLKKIQILLFICLIIPVFTIYSQSDNISTIRSLEKQYSVKIYFNTRLVENVHLNKSVMNFSKIEDALAHLLEGTGLIYLKIQESTLILVTNQSLKNITEQNDTLNNSSSNSILIGNLSSYQKNKLASIRGKILDGKTGDPIPGAIIFIKSIDLSVSTDFKGTFILSLLPGIYNASFTSIGFEEYNKEINIISSGEFKVELFENSVELDEVAVYAKRADRNVSSDQLSLIEIDSRTLKQLPLLSGEKDIIRSFSMLPGIKSTGEFGTGISVRGGGNDQNLFLIEETPIYNTSHVFGLLSAVSSDVVSNVSLFKGFIPADYGERVSSVIDIQLKRGNEKNPHTNGGIGLFSSRLSVEGPVLNKNTSFIIAGRTSYSNWLLKKIPDAELANSKANFYDVIGGVNSKISENLNLFFMLYRSYDFFNYSNQLEYGNNNNACEIRCNYFRNTFLNYSLAMSYSANSILKKDLEIPINRTLTESGINSLSIRGDIISNRFKYNSIKMGLQTIRYSVNPGIQSHIDTISRAKDIDLQNNRGWESAIYINNNISLLKDVICLNAGIRYSMFFNLGPYDVYNYQPGLPYSEATMTDTTQYKANELIKFYHGLEPRLSLKFQFAKTASVKFAYNRNIQYISMISSSAVQTPDDVWQLSDSYLKPIINNSVVWGLYKNLKDNMFETSFEMYYRTLKNLTEYKNGAKLLMNDHIETELIYAKGKSYGAEFYIKKNKGIIDGWLSYTYSRSLKKTSGIYKEEIINENLYYPSSYDKPHDFNSYLTYHYNKRLRLSFNFTYSTGRAITLPKAIFITENTWKVTYNDRNSSRLPDYHRLDISISLDESIRIKKKWKGSWTFSVLNVYSRKNAYSIFFKGEIPSEENNYRNFGLYKLYIIGRPLPTLTYNFIF